MKKTLTVAFVQQACKFEREENLALSISGIREAAERGADLVLLPELHLGPYFCQSETTEHFDNAEPIPGPATEALGLIARELQIVIVASLFERRAAGLYHNTAVILERNGELIGKYRKMHIPDDPGYYEKFYFTPGDLGFTPIDTSCGRIGVLVCWDQWYPEAARLMTLAGADVLLYPTAIGWNPSDDEAEKARQLEAWVTVQRAHAIANGLPVVACNRVGIESAHDGSDARIHFWGNSFVAGPQGELLYRAGKDEPVVATVELDYGHAEDVRRIWPFLRDRRIDAYGDLTKRYRD